MFNNVISRVSDGKYAGQVCFYNNADLIQSIDFGKFGSDSFGGQTTYMNSFNNVFAGGLELDALNVAQSSVHELFHTLRLAHPFELTQSEDTELHKNGVNNYSSTSNTDKNIVNNIMSYQRILIDGKKGDNLINLTKGQFDFILKEIDLQNQGYGYMNKGKGYEEYMDYWLNWPGEIVQ